MHYLQFIFLNWPAVMPPTLPLLAILYYTLTLLFTKKTFGILINYRLGCNNSHMFLHVHNNQTWTQIVTLPTVPHKS